jgi:hypothetical protein
MLIDLTMLDIGSLVRVLYPDYAAGRRGTIEARESDSRWLIRLEPLDRESEPPILSLEETEFEVIRSSRDD